MDLMWVLMTMMVLSDGVIGDLHQHWVDYETSFCPFLSGFEEQIFAWKVDCVMMMLFRESNRCRQKMVSAP